jgi:hypothetical protein
MLLLAYMGYKFDIITNVSMVLPHISKLDPSGRDKYQRAVVCLHALYHNVWWSGDLDGQYTHTVLRGKEQNPKSYAKYLQVGGFALLLKTFERYHRVCLQRMSILTQIACLNPVPGLRSVRRTGQWWLIQM